MKVVTVGYLGDQVAIAKAVTAVSNQSNAEDH
jgi:hypothetical protein